MPTGTSRCRDESERLAIETAIAFVASGAEHVGPLVELMAMADTVEWCEFWAPMAP